MKASSPSDPPDGPQQPPAFPGGELTAAEVGQLWSFIHGDVMEPVIRQHLRAALGLCARHTWGYAVVEIELWLIGAGRRGGHQPFDVCVLYEDLLGEAIARLTGRHLPWRTTVDRFLVSRAPCWVCDLLQPAAPGAPSGASGYAGSDTASLTAEANRMVFTTRWCRETQPVWRGLVCSACQEEHLGAEGAENQPVSRQPAVSQPCRQHLLQAGDVGPAAAAATAERLRDIRRRILALLESMTAGGTAATQEDDSSWVEALGWFAGWRLPLALTIPAGTSR